MKQSSRAILIWYIFLLFVIYFFSVIKDADDTFQFFFVTERDTDFTFAFLGAGQLHFGAEEAGKLLLQHVELFGQFGAFGRDFAAAAFYGFAFIQGLYYFLYFADGIAMLQYLFKNLHLQFGVAQRYQGAGMSHVYLFVLPGPFGWEPAVSADAGNWRWWCVSFLRVR